MTQLNGATDGRKPACKLVGTDGNVFSFIGRVKRAGQRRTLRYFTERKVSGPGVAEKLKTFGFLPGNYTKVVVSWGWNEDVPTAAKQAGVELWDFRDILKEIAGRSRTDRTYFTDDTMRTLQLMAMATKA